MRAQRMSPKMPASTTPIALATTRHPGGMSSIATRVERGEDQASGVARSSRAGMKRKVKARADHTPLPFALRAWAAHPDVAQPLLQQQRGDRRGRNALQDFDDRVLDPLRALPSPFATQLRSASRPPRVPPRRPVQRLARRAIFAADEAGIAEFVETRNTKSSFSSPVPGSWRTGTEAIWTWPMIGISASRLLTTSPWRIWR